MKYSYDASCSLLVANKNITKEYFLKQAGAYCGYAKDMFSRIYDSIFSEAELLEEIFKKYYMEEYSCLEDFLYHKYSMEKDEIENIMNIKNSSSEYVIYDFRELDYGDAGSIIFAFSDEMYKRIINILLMKIHDED